MNEKITNLYKKSFFQSFGEQLLQARQQQGLEIEDLSEISGFSKIKLQSIEKGIEKRLLRILLENLLTVCEILNKKLTFTLEDCPEEVIDEAKLLPVSDDDLLRLIVSRIK